MPKKNRLPFVQIMWRDRKAGIVRGYRGWAMFEGVRKFGPTRSDAMDAHRDALTMRSIADAPAWGGTFETRANEWLAAIGATLAPDSIDFYRGKLATIWRTIPKTMPVERITAAIVREFVREAREQHGLSARTVQHCRRTLNSFFAWMLRRNFARHNPVAAVDWPKPADTMPDVLNELELASLLSRITDPWAADLSVFMAHTTLRRAEVARLRCAEVDVQGKTMWVRGKSRAQSHPIFDDALAATERLLTAASEREFVVPGITDRARREKVAETFRRWQRKLQEPRWHPHTLRHSVGTILLRKGVSGPVVQRLLRHSSYATTQRYAHLVETDLHESARRLRLVSRVEGEAEHG
jgi:integrase/recombinase XerD